ncbi:MAG TPA: phage Gp37/Gp68 family protein [Pseudoxanthomonas sp.]
MADRTHIEWTDATWNIITGCSVVSAGCKHCYAMKLAGTRLAHHPSRKGLTIDTAAGPVWTGEVRFNGPWLTQPLAWSWPRRIFVCAHGDLFHEAVPDEWIDQVFAVMALAPQHTFQVLTKRAGRMRQYLSDENVWPRIEVAARRIWRELYGQQIAGKVLIGPLPNIWLGVSVEDQAAADERVIHLLRTPAAVRWVSAEPLLGPVRLWLLGKLDHEEDSLGAEVYALSGTRAIPDCDWKSTRLDWVVVGGESGPGARPMNPQWARDLRDQCATAGVPFLFKQWGSWVSVSEVEGAGAHHTFPDGRTVRNVGKRRAGRLLDGVEHNGFPEVRA